MKPIIRMFLVLVTGGAFSGVAARQDARQASFTAQVQPAQKTTSLPAAARRSELSRRLPSDTLAHRDSTHRETLVSDPKEGFRDLFVANTLRNGFNDAQLNPRAVSFVQDYMQKHGRSLEKMKGWGKPYFDMIESILEQHGVPGEMKYLAVIESDLKPTAVSWAGAVGPWQFMPETARNNGLRVDGYVDERTDYFKSTHAAAHYLTMLYNQYRDWLLVIAAYNGGAGNVNSAIRRSGSHNFWDLQYYLPSESRDHVKKFIATHYIMEGQGSITTATKDEALGYLIASPQRRNISSAEMAGSRVLTISGKYNAAVIAKYVSMDITAFNRYNPGFDSQIATDGTYDLRLPNDQMDQFMANKFQILNESLQVLLSAAQSKPAITARNPR
ncbi:MAG TPA: lytic transglycosylase domain-containing protein [Chitinophagaceae bacterium]|nr:lytic transglycosylase domain-containing protein [Chitinophagaceae bacterium]